MKHDTAINVLSAIQALSGAVLLVAAWNPSLSNWLIWVPFATLTLAFACSVAAQYSEVPANNSKRI